MATLSNNPLNWELEDFIAAHFASRRVFVETGVTDRDPKDILELDVVWTDYSAEHARRIPVEVKSGKWGLGDIFKFFGWTRYVDIEPGVFICRNLPSRVEEDAIIRLCEKLGISFHHIADVEEVHDRLAPLGLPEPTGDTLPLLWRYSYWARRRLLNSLSKAIELEVCPETAKLAKDYFKLVNDAIFFEPDVRTRVGSLIESHWVHPKLAKATAAEIAGEEVSLDDPVDTTVFTAALYQGRHFPVQSCLYLEQRARIAIVKAAVDYIIARDAGELPENIIRIFEHELDLGEAQLHAAFHEAVRALDESPSYRCFPIFWQTFLWIRGGFVLTDRLDEEYEWLSAETGMPVDQIDGALDLWDRMFPTPGGWFVQPGHDTRRMLKLMPTALRGIGAYSRLMQYGFEEYTEMGYVDATAGRLATDHNTCVRLLDGDDAELVQ